MKTVRVLVVYLLAVALPLPSWGAALMPCMALQQSTAAEETVHQGHGLPGDAHAQHQHQDSQQPAAPECTCCDGCAEACAFTGCSSTALISPSGGQVFDLIDHGEAPRKIGFYPDPRPHPLFRPPIL